MRRSVLACCAPLLLVACRLGGPEGNPGTKIEEETDPAVVGPDGDTADGGENDTDDPIPTGDGDGDSADDPGSPDDDGLCTPPAKVEGCDPVKGTDCTVGINQCVVNPDSQTPAGRCVFPSAPMGADCDENLLYTTCPTGFTCKDKVCRKYCYCDTDCDQGDTCSEPSEQGGSDLFKLCMNTKP